MTFSQLLDALQASALSRQIALADHLFTAALQVLHVIGFVLMLSSWVLIVLRQYGVIFASSDMSAIIVDSKRLILLGLTLAIVTGAVMVIGAPHHYFSNAAFQVKLVLIIAAALVQVATFSLLSRPRPPSHLIRFAVSISAVLWFGVSIAGRAIGFV